MSITAIGLDGLLIMLLLITFTLGLRLNGRLKGLRNDHASFAKAVNELDQALARAEAGLREMRAAGAETQAALAARIQEARAAATRLDELNARAALAPTPHPVIDRAAAELAVLDLARRAPPREAPAAAAAPADAPIPLEPRREARSRARVDEDLFETPESFPRLKFASGGGR